MGAGPYGGILKWIMRHGLWMILPLFLIGCGTSALDTGYLPKPLDMPLSQREALYADPYSAQAIQAQQEKSSSDTGSVFEKPGHP